MLRWMVALAVVATLGASAATASSRSAHKVAAPASPRSPHPAAAKEEKIVKVVKSDQEWKQALTPDQYRILRRKGTEIAFTGKYWDNHASGVYVCAGCGLELFRSSTKFDSGTGWPSFWEPTAPSHVTEITDASLGMVRTEVECARCGGHLGHVFDDGPAPTHLRYCINSAALGFETQK